GDVAVDGSVGRGAPGVVERRHCHLPPLYLLAPLRGELPRGGDVTRTRPRHPPRLFGGEMRDVDLAALHVDSEEGGKCGGEGPAVKKFVKPAAGDFSSRRIVDS